MEFFPFLNCEFVIWRKKNSKKVITLFYRRFDKRKHFNYRQEMNSVDYDEIRVGPVRLLPSPHSLKVDPSVPRHDG